MGKGRPKGSKNRVSKEHLELAMVIAKSAIMEKTELMEKLSRQARADIGKHLKIDDKGDATVRLDPEHTDILREVAVTPAGTRIKIESPIPALLELAEIYGLKKQPPPSVDMKVSIQTLQANLTPAQLREAALAAIAQED